MDGYVHSAPVPKLYKAAARIASLVKERGQSIKELIYSDKYKRFNTKGLCALIINTIEHHKILDQLISETKILSDGRLDPWLARVLITELMWGKQKLPSNTNCKPITAVLKHQPTFVHILRTAVKNGSHENIQRKVTPKPRYVRVNTLALSIDEAVNYFKVEGWVEGFSTIPNNYTSFLDKVANIGSDEFIQDFHVKEVFVFPPRTEFFDHLLYHNGSLILQDKATTLPSFLLNPLPGCSVLDMCAAPGLKTTHLAAIMKNEGILYAVEKDFQRFKTLNEYTSKHYLANITTINTDATNLTPLECPNVEYILVDPTCSCSGMRKVVKDHERIGKLASFQTIILERALTVFPNVKRVVYSTCSSHSEENEQVVEKVLSIVKNFRLAELDEVWSSRGSKDYDCGQKCLYFNQENDYTTGIFIAVFEKISDDELKEIKAKEKAPTKNRRHARNQKRDQKKLLNKECKLIEKGIANGEKIPIEKENRQSEIYKNENYNNIEVKKEIEAPKETKKKHKVKKTKEEQEMPLKKDKVKKIKPEIVEEVFATKKRKKGEVGEVNEKIIKQEVKKRRRDKAEEGNVEMVETEVKKKKKDKVKEISEDMVEQEVKKKKKDKVREVNEDMVEQEVKKKKG